LSFYNLLKNLPKSSNKEYVTGVITIVIIVPTRRPKPAAVPSGDILSRPIAVS